MIDRPPLPLVPEGWPPCSAPLGGLLEPSCDNGNCAPCRLRRAVETAGAIAVARAERSSLITINEAIADWKALAEVPESVVPALGRVQEILSGHYSSPCPLVGRIELNQKNQPHVHVLQWGSRLRAKRLRDACHEAGLKGITKIQGLTHPPRHIAFYLMKMALLPYVLDPSTAAIATNFDERLNPGLLAVESPEFWRDDGGQALSSLQKAQEAGKHLIQDVLHWTVRYPFDEKLPPCLREALRGAQTRDQESNKRSSTGRR